jgi:hypothetical protein
MKNTQEFTGRTFILTEYGIIEYCYNNKITNMDEFIKIEYMAKLKAMKKRHHLFEVYDTNAISYTAVGLN